MSDAKNYYVWLTVEDRFPHLDFLQLLAAEEKSIDGKLKNFSPASGDGSFLIKTKDTSHYIISIHIVFESPQSQEVYSWIVELLSKISAVHYSLIIHEALSNCSWGAGNLVLDQSQRLATKNTLS